VASVVGTTLEEDETDRVLDDANCNPEGEKRARRAGKESTGWVRQQVESSEQVGEPHERVGKSGDRGIWGEYEVPDEPGDAGARDGRTDHIARSPHPGDGPSDDVRQAHELIAQDRR